MGISSRIKAVIVFCFMMVFFAVSACAKEQLNITLKASFDTCYVNEQYDAISLVEVQENVAYSATAYQLDGDTKVKVECLGGKFVAKTTGFIYVQVKGVLDEKVGYSKEIKLPVVSKSNGDNNSGNNGDNNSGNNGDNNSDNNSGNNGNNNGDNNNGDNNNGDNNNGNNGDNNGDNNSGNNNGNNGDNNSGNGGDTGQTLSDLSESTMLYSVATDNYGAKSLLEQQTAISLDGKALKSTIPDRSQYNTGYGNNFDVWSWLCIPISNIYQAQSVDLSNKYLSFCVKFSNASEKLSFIVEDVNGTFSQEVVIDIGNKYNAFSYCKQLENGWYQVYIRFMVLGGETFSQRNYPLGTSFDVTQSTTILLTTTNVGKNTQNPAYVYFDKMSVLDEVLDSNVTFNNTEIYLPNPNSHIDTDVLFIGNSFIYSSDVGAILQGIANENNKNLFVESYSKGNGLAFELYNMALMQYNNSWHHTWGYKLFHGEYDILIIQAMFNWPEGAYLFYDKLQELNITTQIILMPADNEGAMPEIFQSNFTDKFGLLNWQRLVYTLKNYYKFTNWDLNQAADDWHANALSGYAAATMTYYALYNEMPTALTLTHNKLMAGYYISGSSIAPYTFSMRGTVTEKTNRFFEIRNVAKQIVDDSF